MKALNLLGWFLVIIGALNWGLVGAFDFNLVHAILGSVPVLEKLVYIIVGLCGLYELVRYFTVVDKRVH